MAIFKCDKCGATKEGRCKPKKCAACGGSECMSKQEEAKASGGCGCGCKAKKK
ncbi:MAG: RCKP-type rubredoxin-like domain-containing protein [Thermodesulfobacteriota bacterium]